MNADEILVLTEQGIVGERKAWRTFEKQGFYHELYYGNQWQQKWEKASMRRKVDAFLKILVQLHKMMYSE